MSIFTDSHDTVLSIPIEASDLLAFVNGGLHRLDIALPKKPSDLDHLRPVFWIKRNRQYGQVSRGNLSLLVLLLLS
jgi:hypothetical protein